jgi:hypothetical protein
VVHLNRVLQQLRKTGLVALSHGQLSIIDGDALYLLGEFRAGHLRFGSGWA